MWFDRQSIRRTRLALIWSDLIWFHFHSNAFTDFNVSFLVSWLHGMVCCFSILLVSLCQNPMCASDVLCLLHCFSWHSMVTKSPLPNWKSQISESPSDFTTFLLHNHSLNVQNSILSFPHCSVVVSLFCLPFRVTEHIKFYGSWHIKKGTTPYIFFSTLTLCCFY